MTSTKEHEMDMEFGRAYCPGCDGEGVTYSDWHRAEGEAGERVCRKCGGTGWVPAQFVVSPETNQPMELEG